jgi:hypothetical protein
MRGGDGEGMRGGEEDDCVEGISSAMRKVVCLTPPFTYGIEEKDYIILL